MTHKAMVQRAGLIAALIMATASVATAQVKRSATSVRFASAIQAAHMALGHSTALAIAERKHGPLVVTDRSRSPSDHRERKAASSSPSPQASATTQTPAAEPGDTQTGSTINDKNTADVRDGGAVGRNSGLKPGENTGKNQSVGRNSAAGVTNRPATGRVDPTPSMPSATPKAGRPAGASNQKDGAPKRANKTVQSDHRDKDFSDRVKSGEKMCGGDTRGSSKFA